jgi:hypothetical protein
MISYKEWKEVTKVKNPAVRPTLLEKIRKLLFWEREEREDLYL